MESIQRILEGEIGTYFLTLAQSSLEYAHEFKRSSQFEPLDLDHIASIHMYTMYSGFRDHINLQLSTSLVSPCMPFAKLLYSALHRLQPCVARVYCSKKPGEVEILEAYQKGRILTW